MLQMKYLPLALALLLAGPVGAQKMYRCGSTFSQQPCGADAKVIETQGVAPPAATRISPADKTESQRLEGIIANSQRDRRRQDLRDKWLPEAEVALTGHRSGCERQQASLTSSQYAYQQNLYGKLHATQVAAEMAAAASKCDMKDRDLQEKLSVLTKECAELKCR